MRRRVSTLALLWFTGVYLRVLILAAAPLATIIGRDLHLGQAGTGMVTTLPVLMLALGALPGARLIARLGARRTLALALLLAAVASTAQGLAPPAFLLFAATTLVGLGVAMMQPALPVLVARWCPQYIALGSAVYMNGSLTGEFIGGGLTLPLVMPLTGGNWRATFALYALPALLIVAILLLPRDARRPPSRQPRPVWQPDWKDRRVWLLGLLLGSAGTVFFGTNAYMGNILEARDDGGLLPLALFLFNISQVLASLSMLALSHRLLRHRAPLVIVTAASGLGMAMFVTLGTGPALAGAILVGFASALTIVLLVSLPPLMAGPEEAGQLAAGMFTIGYSLAFAVPLAGGLLANAAHRPSAALLPMLALSVLAPPTALGLAVPARRP